MLARRLRRRPNIEPTLVQCLVFAVMSQRCDSHMRRDHVAVVPDWVDIYQKREVSSNESNHDSP